jgi:hypothetical protein
LIGEKIPLIRQVANLSRNWLEERALSPVAAAFLGEKAGFSLLD